MNKKNKVILGVAMVALFMGAFIQKFNFNAFAAREGTQATTFTANLGTSLSVSIPTRTVSLNVTPSMSGASSNTSNYNVVVYTNNSAGFQLYANSTSNNLVSEYNATIPGITNTTCYSATSSIPVNHWGISWNSGNYCRITTTPAVVASSASATGNSGSTTTFRLGAKLDLNTEPGEYMVTLNFYAVANV